MYHAIPTFYHYLPPTSHFFPPSVSKMGEIPTRHTLPRPWLTDAVLDDKNAIAQPYIAAAAAWSRAFGVLS